MEGKKLKLRNLPSRTSSLSCSAANAVGTSLKFAALNVVKTSNLYNPL